MKKFNYHNFSNALKGFKVSGDKQWSIREIAKQSGVTHVCVHRAMKGNNLDVDNILRLCDWMGVPLTHFVSSD